MRPTPTVSPRDYPLLSLALLNICQDLPDGFSLQDVIDRVLVQAPEMLEDLPRVWADLRQHKRVLCCGMDSTHFQVSRFGQSVSEM